jgi:hypothetical protein
VVLGLQDPDGFVEYVKGLQKAVPQHMSMSRNEQAVPAAVLPATSRIDQLKGLTELKSQGILTQAEFDKEKARVLNGGSAAVL